MYMKVQTTEKSDLEKNNSLWQKACLIFVNIKASLLKCNLNENFF